VQLPSRYKDPRCTTFLPDGSFFIDATSTSPCGGLRYGFSVVGWAVNVPFVPDANGDTLLPSERHPYQGSALEIIQESEMSAGEVQQAWRRATPPTQNPDRTFLYWTIRDRGAHSVVFQIGHEARFDQYGRQIGNPAPSVLFRYNGRGRTGAFAEGDFVSGAGGAFTIRNPVTGDSVTVDCAAAPAGSVCQDTVSAGTPRIAEPVPFY
jgi:hypothetical protein